MHLLFQRFINIIFLLSLLLLFFSCESKKDSQNDQELANKYKTVLLNPGHEFWQEAAPELFSVIIKTTKGEFIIEVHRDWAPIGVDRFYNLVRSGFFDDSRFYRVRAGFIAQFGLPGNPEITKAWQNRTMPDDPVKQSNTRGTIAYAMTGPDTRTTQLFINYIDNSRLDEQGFAPIGRVIEGMAVVDNLYSGYDESAGGGMRGGKQGKILEFGNVHLDNEFPKLDRLEKAIIVNQKNVFLKKGRQGLKTAYQEDIIFGVVEYEIQSNGTLNGTWTIPNFDGKLRTEITTGGTSNQLEGCYSVNTYGRPDGNNIYPDGKLEISKNGETYYLI